MQCGIKNGLHNENRVYGLGRVNSKVMKRFICPIKKEGCVVGNIYVGNNCLSHLKTHFSHVSLFHSKTHSSVPSKDTPICPIKRNTHLPHLKTQRYKDLSPICHSYLSVLLRHTHPNQRCTHLSHLCPTKDTSNCPV